MKLFEVKQNIQLPQMIDMQQIRKRNKSYGILEITACKIQTAS